MILCKNYYLYNYLFLKYDNIIVNQHELLLNKTLIAINSL